MLRRLLFWVLVIVFIWVVITQFDEIKMFAHTLAQGRLGWILVAAVLVLIYNIIFAFSFKVSFDAADIHMRMSEVTSVMLASLFVGVVAPGGSATGMALFVDDAVRRGHSAARAAVGLLIQTIADFTSLTIVMGTGLIYMISRGEADIYAALGVGSILVMAIGLVGVLLIGLWRPTLLQRLFKFFQRLVNAPAGWLKRPNFLEDDWAEESAEEFIGAASAIVRHPAQLFYITLIMLTVNIIDVTILKVVFLSFGYNIGIGALVAGFSMMTLASIISPAPQGIGVVEGTMVYVFDSMGVPWEINLTTSLAYRGLTFWLPMIAGFLLLRRVKTFQVEKGAPVPGGSIPLLATLIALMGVYNILAVVAPSLAGRAAILQSYSPLYVPYEHALAAIISGIALIFIAYGLLRHKRLTWLASLILLIIVITAHAVVGGPKDQQAILGAGIGVWLLFLADQCTVRSDWPSIRRGLYVMAGAFVCALVYGTAGFLLLGNHFTASPDFWLAFRQTALLFAQLSLSALEPATHLGQWFVGSIYLIGAAAFIYFLMMLDRPVQLHQSRPRMAEERKRARQIVEAHGRSSMAYLALLDDKHYYLSPGDSLIAFTVRGRVAVTSSDPIGPQADMAAAVVGFKELCRQNDWIPAFCLTLPETQELYRKEGFRSICLGHEAVVDLQTFTLAGRARRSYRKRYNRFLKQNYRVIFHPPPLSDELMAELRQVSDEWLAITPTNGAEKRFFLGWFDDETIRNCPIAAVHDSQGRITAFANLISEYQLNETTIDLMRHRRVVASGTMDYLVVSLFKWAQEKGYDSFNLGLSALSGIGEAPGSPWIERLLYWLYESGYRTSEGSQRYNFKGLRNFKAKFRPSWTPQYLALPSLTNLPAVWISMALVNAGGWGAKWGYAKKRGSEELEVRRIGGRD